MTPHKHHDLIVAWAKGAKIQWYDGQDWETVIHPGWSLQHRYRVKPEPKPDVVTLVHVNRTGYVWNSGTGVWQSEGKNLRITIDGETCQLKKAEVINEE